MNDPLLRETLLAQLTRLLDGGEAHVRLSDAVANLPFAKQGIVPHGLPYSAWQLLEHLRLAQRDILDFSDNADGSYQPMTWPADYWPVDPAPPGEGAWQRCLDQLRMDRERFETLLEAGSLTEPFPWGQGQTLLREALLIADHNAYHLGEIIAVRRLLGEWSAA